MERNEFICSKMIELNLGKIHGYQKIKAMYATVPLSVLHGMYCKLKGVIIKRCKISTKNTDSPPMFFLENWTEFLFVIEVRRKDMKK